MFWPDRGSGVDVEPARRPVQSLTRQYFTEGGLGQAPTVPGADWFNQITNELLSVIVEAGITPDKSVDDQLLKAIKALKVNSGFLNIVDDFGAKPIPGFDNSSAFAACHLYLSTLAASATSSLPTVLWPAGVYEYSSMPNWAIDNLSFKSLGVVRLRFTGTADPLTIRGAQTKYNINIIGGFIVEADADVTTSTFITDNTAHCRYDVKVTGAGAGMAAFEVGFAVCNHYMKPTASHIEEPWFSDAQPATGLLLKGGSAGHPVSFCIFENILMEGVSGIGVDLVYAYGNVFLVGTSEGNAIGAYFRSATGPTQDAFNNVFMGTDFEANTDHDVYFEGRENTLRDVTTDKIVTFAAGSVGNRVAGGVHQSIYHASSAVNNSCHDLTYNRNGSGSITDDSHGKLAVRDVYNRALGRHEASWTGVFVLVPTIVAGAIVYNNTSNNPITLSVSGGVVTAITYSIDGVSSDTLGTSGLFTLQPRSTLTIVCSVAPRMVEFKG
ncbi:hypothetical protein [Aeromonas sp. L_1B5_3]|uniref:hypothetical protein n=1 Tax=Aeromonas sp. L_1B5_3 TaxID=1588629 RepID=UPI000A4875CA|nr:hypothetical protein [Aeromonas sp. L_1B5_3]